MDAGIWTNVIAGFALLVSIASAAYAWDSAAEAKRANKISSHQYQKQLYEEFVNIHDRLTEQKEQLEGSVVFGFEPYARTAVLYVDSSLAKEIWSFHLLCVELIALQGRACHEMKLLRSLQNDPISSESEGWDNHIETIRASVSECKMLSEAVMDQLGKAVNLSDRIEKELIRKLKIVP